jgi:hypothetical protein
MRKHVWDLEKNKSVVLLLWHFKFITSNTTIITPNLNLKRHE